MSQMLIIMLNVVNLLIHFVVKMIKSFVKRFNRLKYFKFKFLTFLRTSTSWLPSFYTIGNSLIFYSGSGLWGEE